MKQLAFSRTIRLSAVLKSSDFIGTVAGNVICHRYTLTKELGGGFPLRKAGEFSPLISAAKALHRLAVWQTVCMSVGQKAVGPQDRMTAGPHGGRSAGQASN